MRKFLITILVALCALPAYSQPRSDLRANRIIADKALLPPVIDTSFIPDRIGHLVIRPQDTTLWVGLKTTAGGKHWYLFTDWIGAAPGGGGVSDTTDISNFYLKVRSLFSVTYPLAYSNGLTTLDTTIWHGVNFYNTLYPRLSASYSDPSWISSLAWSKITGKPTTLGGYGIADAPTTNRFTDSLLAHTARFNGVTGALATKFNLSDTSAAFAPYARIETSATGSIAMWKSNRALGSSSILYDNGVNAGATGTFLAPAMKSATSTSYYSFRVDGNLGMGEVFADGSYIQRMTIANYHYIQSVNPPANGLFIGTFPGQSYINFKNDGRILYDTLDASAQRHTFKGSGRFTDSLFVKTLENLDDSSDVAATTKWVKQQLYGTGSGSGPSDTAHVIVDTTLNAMAKVISVDSLRFKSIAFQINGVTKNPVKTDSTLLWNFPIDSSDIANFSVKVRSLFSATGPITYSNGKIGIDTAAGKHRSEGYYDTKYQPKLVSGTNIKTVNGNSLLGPGDISISTVVAFDSTYHPIVVFSAGAGFVADTALFTDSTLYGSFYTDQDSFFIDKIVVVMKGQTGDSLGIRLTYNDSININGTHINNGTIPVNSRTTGDVVTIAVNRGIPPLSWLWLKSPTVIPGKKPEYLSVTIIGYRKYIAP